MLMLAKAPQGVEIIDPGECVDVYVRRSPLRQQREHVTVEAGLSIAEIIEHCGITPIRLYVTINGHAIETDNWHRVRVKSGAVVSIVKVPGKGAFRAILGLVVALAAVFFAPIIAGAIGLAGSATATSLIGAGITIAGSLIVNALFPAPKAEGPQVDNTKTLYSIGGAQNEAVQYGAIPEIFGVHRISPPYAAQSYTEIVGDDQYLRMLFCVGYGPISMGDVRIAETPITNFAGISYEIIADHTVQAPTLYTKPVYEESISVLLDYPSSWVQRTTADDVDEISVDISMPNGLYLLRSSDGKRVNFSILIEVQYAVAGSGVWASFGHFDITASSAQAIRRSLAIAVSRGKFDVRMRKFNPDYVGNDNVSETAYWTALRARRNESVINFDKPLALIALRIKASNELNGTVNQLNLQATPLIRRWNGSSWVAGQASRNPADHFRHVLQGNANARPVPDAAIDLVSIQQWHAFCNSEGFTFDLVATEQVSVYDRLTQIAAAGRASVSFQDGKWGVVWDVEGSDIVQHFTPRNSSSFSSVRAYADLPHGFRVNFINRDNNYLNDERVVYDDGYSAANATKFEGLDFPGVTSSDLIWRHGRYHIAQLRLQRETYSLTTDFEHLVCTRGDRVRVNHDVVLWGLGSARVKSVSGTGVTLDDTMTMSAGTSYSIRFRLADGSSIVRTVDGIDGEFTEFTFSDAGAFPAVGDLAQFGTNGMESVILRVKSITPQQDLSAVLELVDDAPGILAADTGTIPPFDTGIPPLVDYRSQTPTNLTFIESIWSTVPPTSQVDLSWFAPIAGRVTSYIVQYSVKGTGQWFPSQTVGSNTATITDLPSGSYDVRVRAVFDNGQLSGWLNAVVTATIFAVAPPDVTGFKIAVTGDIGSLDWDAIAPEVGVAYYEVRYSPILSTIVPWQSATLLRTNISGPPIAIQPRRGTYLIKAVSWSGLQSVNASIIVNTIDGLTAFNSVETIVEDAPFPGVKDGTFFDGEFLRLGGASDFFELEDVFAPADFFLSEDGYLPFGYYYFEDIIDLDDVYTSRVSAFIDAHGQWSSDDFFAQTDVFERVDFFGGIGSEWNVQVEISTSEDDPDASPTWTDWQPLVTGDFTARGFRFRAKLETLQPDITPLVEEIVVTIDMPDRVIAGSDIVIPPGGIRVEFTPAFKHLNGISIAAQELETGDYYLITNKDETGFDIEFKDDSNSDISRILDYVAKGYGTVQ